MHFEGIFHRRGAGIDQVCVPTVKEMVWEFPRGFQSKVFIIFLYFIFSLKNGAVILRLRNLTFIQNKLARFEIGFCL